jgi:hypothetical protein
MLADPNFRVIAELTLAKSAAVEGVERIVDDRGAAIGMLAEGDIEAAADLLEIVHGAARELLDSLTEHNGGA